MLGWLHIFVEIRMLFTVLQSICVWKVALKTFHANFVSQIIKRKYNTLFSLSEVSYLIEWLVNIISGNGFMLSGNKPLTWAIVDQDLGCHTMSLSYIEIIDAILFL